MVAPFNSKARLWLNGRKNIFAALSKISSTTPSIWFHCSSLGEFEQGRPVMEKLRLHYPGYQIVLTFFSPSGYEVRKNFTGADHVFYLPMDSAENANRFLDLVHPALIVFIKYEFWFYYLQGARRRHIPLLLVSALFRKGQPFFKSWGQLHREMLAGFTHFFVQDQESKDLLHSIGIEQATIAGDTRYDRVIEIAEQFKSLSFFDSFCRGANVIVAGSTWTEDDKELAHFANTRKDLKFIIAPHNIIQDRLDECLRYYDQSILYSTVSDSIVSANCNTVIIDNIGMLSSLYRYATISFVGGGFGADGVHNVLEAAVYGKPVVFGPEYEKYIEADGLIEAGGAVSVENTLELEEAFVQLLKLDTTYYKVCEAARNFVLNRAGSTQMIVEFIQEKRLLTR